MRARILIACFLSLLGWAAGAASEPAPEVLAAPVAAKLSATFERRYKVRLGCTGLAFYQGDLFVGSNLGLMEFHHGALVRDFRWDRFDSVVEGPWLDSVHGLLWLWRPGADDLDYDAGGVWRSVAVPEPKKGIVMRGDIMAGYRGYSGKADFWLEGARHAWIWQASLSQWVEQDIPGVVDPKNDPYPSVLRLIPASDRTYFVISHSPGWGLRESRSETVCTRNDDGSWSEVPNRTGGGIFADRTVAAGAAGYILTTHGMVLRVDPDGITAVEAPGYCLALATTTHGTLLAAFRGGDICERADHWRMVCHVPIVSGGKAWSHLAEDGGTIAFATESESRPAAKDPSGVDVPGVPDSGQTLWLWEDGTLRPIAWPPTAPSRKP